MKFKKWLKPMDTAGLNCNIYIQYEKMDGTEDADLIYAGSMWNIPYWLVEYNIAPNDLNGEAIAYCHNMYKNIDDETGTPDYNGFCIYLQEKED